MFDGGVNFDLYRGDCFDKVVVLFNSRIFENFQVGLTHKFSSLQVFCISSSSSCSSESLLCVSMCTKAINQI